MKTFWLAVDFLGIGWAVFMALIIVLSTWGAYLGNEIGLEFNRFGELRFEVWWHSIFWLLSLAAFVRVFLRLSEHSRANDVPALIILRGELATWARGGKQ